MSKSSSKLPNPLAPKPAARAETWWCIKNPGGELEYTGVARDEDSAWLSYTFLREETGSAQRRLIHRMKDDGYSAVRIRVSELRQQKGKRK